MKLSKSLLVLAGSLGSDSLAAQQLKISSLFELYIHGKKYFSEAVADLTETAKYSDFSKAPTLGSSATVTQIVGFLDVAHPNWKAYSSIIFYPISIYSPHFRELDAFIAKLTTLDSSAKIVFNGINIFVLPTQSIASIPNRNVAISDLPAELTIESNLQTFDLASPMGIFSMSKTQTKARDFNQLEVDWPYILKTTKDIKKGQREFDFYQQVPSGLRAYFPQVGGSQVKGETFSYQIEFLPIFDLSRFLIHRALSANELWNILSEIENYFKISPTIKVSSEEYKKQLKDLFVDKLWDRYLALQNLAVYKDILNISENIFRGGFDLIIDRLAKQLEDTIAQIQVGDLYFSHGDMCFSNILWDQQTKRMKLIDPRGGSSPSENFRPIYYDLAKLSHSIVGGYDFIMNDLSEVEFNQELRLSLKIDSTFKDNEDQKNMFVSWLKRMNVDQKLVRLGEASLFLSMLPLHSDRPDLMVKQICAGVSAFNSLDRE